MIRISVPGLLLLGVVLTQTTEACKVVEIQAAQIGALKASGFKTLKVEGLVGCLAACSEHPVCDSVGYIPLSNSSGSCKLSHYDKTSCSAAKTEINIKNQPNEEAGYGCISDSCANVNLNETDISEIKLPGNANFTCQLNPPPILNYVCNATRCVTDVFDNLDPNGSFCCYCNAYKSCTKTSKFQHGAPLDGTVTSCEMVPAEDGTGGPFNCTKDSDCNLRWTCSNRKWTEGVDTRLNIAIKPSYTFYDNRWPLGLPPVCTTIIPDPSTNSTASG